MQPPQKSKKRQFLLKISILLVFKFGAGLDLDNNCNSKCIRGSHFLSSGTGASIVPNVGRSVGRSVEKKIRRRKHIRGLNFLCKLTDKALWYRSLYNPKCRSVCRSVGRSVGRSVEKKLIRRNHIRGLNFLYKLTKNLMKKKEKKSNKIK